MDLVNYFGERCHRIGRKLNLVTEEFYDEAQILARALDQEREDMVREGKSVPILHGIPISVKD